ncbi:MAG: putative toxin-antitoxin system toxin component, PIN family [Spirochaetales bacterium]|nr:putative toxin-antitoxin system toxin component, PIN family [Spirochaetales bacterium]
MKIVMDTSVLYQALYSNAGASHAILTLIRAGELVLALSIPVFEEYSDVLSRESSLEHFELKPEDIQQVLEFIALVGARTDIRYLLRPNLRDESDNIFMELAFASDAKFLITKNIRDFTYKPELKLDEIQIVTPAEFMHRWRDDYA